jgi:flavin-dependent dehydrogenase
VERIVIVGGGVAGLSCLNALLDQGVSALLLEAAIIGTPKMCGEFLAPPAVAQLGKWGIGPIQVIKQASFFAKQAAWDLPFPHPAGAYARDALEVQLAARARNLGGRILENSPIQKISPAIGDAPYTVCLASGEVFQAETVIFATGKFGQQGIQNGASPYYGFKIHLPLVVKPETLLMYSQPGAYFGIVPISETVSNCACLVRRNVIENNDGSCKQFLSRLIDENGSLREVFERVDINSLVWLEGRAPQFGLRQIQDWPRAFWIGDALASLPPAIGYGFAHSVESAVMAAESYGENKARKYRRRAIRLIRPKLRMGKLMHRLMLRPGWGRWLFPFLRRNPWVVNIFMRKIGYR